MKLAGYEKAHSELNKKLEEHRDNAVDDLEHLLDSRVDRAVLMEAVCALIDNSTILEEVKLAARNYGILRFLEANAE